MVTIPPAADGRRQEAACASLCFAIVAAFTAFVLVEGSVSPPELARLIATFIGIAVLIAGSALIFFAGVELVRSGRRSRWQERPAAALLAALNARWKQDRLFSALWPIALFLLLVPSFNAFKQRILPHAGFRFDAELAGADRFLFGTDPGMLLHRMIGSPATTGFFDAVYHSWFVPTTLGLCFIGFCAGTRTRAQYMLSYIGVWLFLGAFLAFLVPAAGPAFYAAVADPMGAAPFVAVHQQLELAGKTQFLTSLGNQAYLLANLDAPALVVGGGISAIPSVHNAMAVLFALVSFRAHRLLGIAMSLFALLIWVASVYLNWHYAVDGIAGAAGAILVWFASGKIVDRLLATVEALPGHSVVKPLPVS
jgi:hypothetical protein